MAAIGHGLVDFGLGQADEVGSSQEVAKAIEDLRSRFVELRLGERHSDAGVGIGIERSVSVFQLFERLMKLAVNQSVQLPTKTVESFGFDRGELAPPNERQAEISLAKRNERLEGGQG